MIQAQSLVESDMGPFMSAAIYDSQFLPDQVYGDFCTGADTLTLMQGSALLVMAGLRLREVIPGSGGSQCILDSRRPARGNRTTGLQVAGGKDLPVPDRSCLPRDTYYTRA